MTRPASAAPIHAGPWLPLAQVAQRWQVSVGYVRRLANAGALRTTRVGRHHRCHIEWADAALGYC